MSVPLVCLVSGGGDEPTAGFYQSSSQQDALSRPIAAIAILGLFGFFRKVKGFPECRGQDHFQSLILESIHLGKLGDFYLLTVVLIDDSQHFATVLDSICRYRLRQT